MTTATATEPARTKGRHARKMSSREWLADRRYSRKDYVTSPADWGQHRALTHAEHIRDLAYRVGKIRRLAAETHA